MKHIVNTTWNEKLSFDIESPGGKMTIDAGEEFGGEGKGFRPKPLMLNALAGCTAIDIASLIKKMRLEVDDIQIDVSGDLTDEHPKKYSDVLVQYRFYGNNLNKEKLQKAVDLSVERYCGVIYMFRSFANVKIDIQYFEG